MNECSEKKIEPQFINHLIITRFTLFTKYSFLLIVFLTSPYTPPSHSVRDYQITVKTSMFTVALALRCVPKIAIFLVDDGVQHCH